MRFAGLVLLLIAAVACGDDAGGAGADGGLAADAGLECDDNADCDDPAQPTCDTTDRVCRACAAHTDCESNACLPDGQCASDVAYVVQNGDGDCSQTDPCGTINVAFATGRAVIKVNGSDPVALTERVLIEQGRALTILGDPGATVAADNFAAALFIVQEAGSSATLVDVNLVGAPLNGTALTVATGSLTLERVIVQGLGPGGVGLNATAGATLVMNRSIIARNDGGGVVISDASFTMRNNLIVQNGEAGENTRGLAITPGPSAVFEFNTISENSGLTTTGIACLAAFPAANNIVYSNVGGPPASDTCTFTRSLFTDGGVLPGDGNDDGDPTRFLDRTTVGGPMFFRITDESEAIDLADAASTLTDDIDGVNTRPTGTGGRRDIGADERP